MSEKKKPKTLEIDANDVCLQIYEEKFREHPDHINVDINTTFYNDRKSEIKKIRKIAKWLNEAADYMDFKARL